MDIEGHGAVVVGGASGLGEATARHLAERGADVSILDINGQRAARVAAEIGGYSLHCDVTEEESVAAGITSAMARFGQAPRIVINCARIAAAAPVVDHEGGVSTANFRHVVAVNLIGSYNVMTYAVQGMMDLPTLNSGERGVIINTESTMQKHDLPGQVAYAASMGGVALMCLPAAREFAHLGVRVMAIAPGLVKPPDSDDQPDIAVADRINTIPFPQRSAWPVKFARLAAEIVENSDLNGRVVGLDGAARLPSA